MAENETERSRDSSPEEGRPHGLLIGFSYNYSSHGMMAGSSSFGGTELQWNADGSVVLTSRLNGQGRRTELRYDVKPEIAQELRDYVEEQHLAALAERKIETPAVFDCFTSTTISMTFDSRPLGGRARDTRTLQCGATLMTFATIEKEISALLNRCRESGSLLSSEMHETGSLPGMLGFMSMANPPVQKDAAPSGGSPALPGTKWVCTCGFAENKGKFCMNCGKPRPASENDGRWVCPNCKTARNAGKFCAACGTPRPE